MEMGRRIGIMPLVALAVVCSCPCGGAATGFDATDREVMAGLSRVMREFFWEPTSLIYTCPPEDVEPASTYANGFKIWEKPGDYGKGLEDCAILGGVALGGLCDAFMVTGDRALADDARRIAKGLVNLATVHGVKGFIARGICVEDGKSVCSLSSIDQHTLAVWGLWRYFRSPLADNALRPEIRRVLAEVADRMTEQVTERNDWSFQQAVGRGDTRGICKMRFNRPHEGMRLSMVYAAAWAVTGAREYRDLYRKYVEEGIAKSMELAAARTPQEQARLRGTMPDYALLQMLVSLELVAAVEPDADRRRRIWDCMAAPARIAVRRAAALGVGETQYLCGCGELSIVQSIAGAGDRAERERALCAAIAAKPFADQASCCRIVHLFAAWWRYRAGRLQGGEGEKSHP